MTVVRVRVMTVTMGQRLVTMPVGVPGAGRHRLGVLVPMMRIVLAERHPYASRIHLVIA